MKNKFSDLARQYRDALLHDVIPFWIRHSPDREHGGYFTCLARDGSIYDTEKFVWLQARQVWMFASLYNRLEKNSAWLDLAESGAAFLTSACAAPANTSAATGARSEARVPRVVVIGSSCLEKR